MISRIGNVAYFAGAIFAVLLFLGFATSRNGDPGIIGGAIIAGILFGFGWAVRFVLSGRSDWRFTIE